jgi:hypothetical protein
MQARKGNSLANKWDMKKRKIVFRAVERLQPIIEKVCLGQITLSYI